MSIKPPIKCPPDYSVLVFRLTECKKAGIVKGIGTELAIDLQDLYVPVTNYEERKITLKAGQTKKVDVSSIGEVYPLKEQYTFVANQNYCGFSTSHTYSLYDEDLNLIEAITFSVGASGFTSSLNEAVSLSSQIKTLVSFNASTFATDGTITVTASTAGIKYRHVFAFDNTGWGGYDPYPYLHPGNLTVPYQKYNAPRIKILMVYPDFYKANILNGCNCLDTSGDLKSNKKYIEYAFASDYERITNSKSTPITASPVVNATPYGSNWTWDQSSTDHIGYHFTNGDLLDLSGDTTKRGFISGLQGYFFATDAVIGNLTNAQVMEHVYSPNVINWGRIGDFYLHTTAQDVLDTDKLYIETIYLKNPHNFDLPVKIMLAS